MGMTRMTSTPSRQSEETQQSSRDTEVQLCSCLLTVSPGSTHSFPSGQLHPGSRGKILSHSLSVPNPGETCIWHQALEMELPAERTLPPLSPGPSKEGFRSAELSNAHGSSCSRAAQNLLTCTWTDPQLSGCKTEWGMAGNIGGSQGEGAGSGSCHTLGG